MGREPSALKESSCFPFFDYFVMYVHRYNCISNGPNEGRAGIVFVADQAAVSITLVSL